MRKKMYLKKCKQYYCNKVKFNSFGSYIGHLGDIQIDYHTKCRLI